MKQKESFQFTTGVIAYPLLFILLIWLVFWFEVRFGYHFNKFGLYPQTIKGLRGILFGPFIHGDIEHIYHNTVPLFVLSAALFYFYRPIAWKILAYGILLSGFLTWCIGRPSYHIGASGLIYVLVSFLFFKGIFAKYYRLVALSLAVIFLYGSMVWYTLPIKEGISWEGHLSGLLCGLFFALVFKKQIKQPIKYVWEAEDYNEADDPFLKHFDENGNFIESIEADDEVQDVKNENPVTYNYIYKSEKGENS
ncbi:rhomboid family intramembrane serine protease [Pseudotamlana carrageenivorans]|uniref:Rhomboid family intramembrane serine protease n=1 Tax=Pseudotamlana carrageenivorans TaxID=2069432 RepID=A0A2I7SFJ4_9FLAO|nr:rhomboid family intramembrane serine protease [Tamlana carrageenivorans]AUS04665.1 rhomboid family intramembrane serine protease [Tamlana carrageenivorans]